MGIMRKSGKVRYYPRVAELSQERSQLLDRGYADFGEFFFHALG
jgi:hypothetical protein